MEKQLAYLLTTLVGYLPPSDEEWSQAKWDRWFEAFARTFELCYPIHIEILRKFSEEKGGENERESHYRESN